MPSFALAAGCWWLVAVGLSAQGPRLGVRGASVVAQAPILHLRDHKVRAVPPPAVPVIPELHHEALLGANTAGHVTDFIPFASYLKDHNATQLQGGQIPVTSRPFLGTKQDTSNLKYFSPLQFSSKVVKASAGTFTVDTEESFEQREAAVQSGMSFLRLATMCIAVVVFASLARGGGSWAMATTESDEVGLRRKRAISSGLGNKGSHGF